MENYVEIIKISIFVFPLVAFIISIPFILIQYHKYGSISFLRGLIIYSFTLYFLCTYFLVILPLPKISEVAVLTTPRMQIIPFTFIVDFITNTSLDIANVHTYVKAIKESYFYVPLYNIVLTLPFGIYLRYYFKCNLKKATLYTLLLSLFFELTQLSGLYFIYPRGYRLFDVDDLILNTLGGVMGYLVAKPLIKKLPKREEIDLKAMKRGKTISGFRRTTAFFLDVFLIMLICILISFINFKYLIWITIFVYYFIIPVLLNGSTLGEKYLNIRVIDSKDKINIFRLLYRNIMFALIYLIIPYLLFYGISNLSIKDYLKEAIGAVFLGGMFIFYVITIIKYLFTNKMMIYERISKTKIVSTTKEISIEKD